jgi:hypothetical protein
MLLVVATGLGFCYYSLGWISNHLSAVCSLLTIYTLPLYSLGVANRRTVSKGILS